MSFSYFYVGNRLVGASNARLENPEAQPIATDIQALQDTSNPIYNFSSDFIKDFQNVSALQLAESVPYISLCSLNRQGQVLDNFNLQFFQKTINMNAINSAARYADRPQLSLKNVRIHSDLASGYIGYSKVSLALKIHKPDSLTNSTLVSLMFPGMPMRLIYGWNSLHNAFMNQKDVLLFNLTEYFITFDVTGQADLVIEGLTQSDAFGSIMVGDTGQSVPPVSGEDIVSDEQVNGISQQNKRAEKYEAHVNSIRIRQNAAGARSTKIIKALAKTYQSVQERASLQIRMQYNDYMSQLRQQKKTDGNKFITIKKRSASSIVVGEYVTVHDIFKTLCGSTLNALEGTYVPANREFRIVYGAFNENLESFSGKSLADFPVSWSLFQQLLSEHSNNGSEVPSLRFVFNTIISEFLNKETYWRNNLINNGVDLNIPQVIMHFTSHLIGSREIVQMSLIDTHKNVPITQKKIADLNVELASQQQIENAVAGDLPIITFGHANSFVKSINVSHHNDQAMRAVFINRAITDRDTNQRQPISSNKEIKSQNDRALFLPLKGEMELIGHIDWKPSRFFYLRSGIFFVDGVYGITTVDHELDASGFRTKIGFTYH